MSLERGLFGGAIVFDLEPLFMDISTIREVPDNQECFADALTDRSVIVEILEMSPGNDMKWFFQDIADANGSAQNQIEIVKEQVDADQVPLIDKFPGASAGILVGTQSASKFNETAQNTVRLFMCNIRLPQFETDILISLNMPVSIDPASSSAEVMESSLTCKEMMNESEHLFDTILKTFSIKNPQLFGC